MSNKGEARLLRLSRVDLFRRCSHKELRSIAALGTEIDVAAGRVLCREGQVGHELCVVVDGAATVTIDGEAFTTVGPGGFFGEVALLDGGPRSATVTATTDMHLLVLSHSEFLVLLEDAPTVARRMLEVMAARFRSATTQCRPDTAVVAIDRLASPRAGVGVASVRATGRHNGQNHRTA